VWLDPAAPLYKFALPEPPTPPPNEATAGPARPPRSCPAVLGGEIEVQRPSLGVGGARLGEEEGEGRRLMGAEYSAEACNVGVSSGGRGGGALCLPPFIGGAMIRVTVLLTLP
jgi:hypothetical protein